jgi:hypothetical protein
MRKSLITLSLGLLLGTSQQANATSDFCAVVLKTSDGFLYLRQSPGAQFKIIARLFRGDLFYADTATCETIDGISICDDRNQWTHVISVPRIDGPLKEAKTFTHGWVNRQYTQEFRCDD